MKFYILSIIISGQLYLESPGLTYDQCQNERADILHLMNRLKVDGDLTVGRAIGLCKSED